VLYDDSGKNSFEWIESGDVQRSIFSFIRRNPWNYNDALIFVVNMTPVEYSLYGVGAPVSGKYKRIFTTYGDESECEVDAEKTLCNGRPYRCTFTLRPFESVIFEVPYHDSTEEELKEEKKVRARVKKEHQLATNDKAFIPDVVIPDELKAEGKGTKGAKSSAKASSKTITKTTTKATAKTTAKTSSAKTATSKKTTAKNK
jgi:1,4-alpha-glucan branching enzyme